MPSTDEEIKQSITAYSVAHAVSVAGHMKDKVHMVQEDSVSLLDYFLKTHQAKQSDLLQWSLVSCLELLPYALQNWVFNQFVHQHYTTAIAMRKHYIESTVR